MPFAEPLQIAHDEVSWVFRYLGIYGGIVAFVQDLLEGLYRAALGLNVAAFVVQHNLPELQVVLRKDPVLHEQQLTEPHAAFVLRSELS